MFFCMLQRVIEHITQCKLIKPRIAQTNKFIGKFKKICISCLDIKKINTHNTLLDKYVDNYMLILYIRPRMYAMQSCRIWSIVYNEQCLDIMNSSSFSSQGHNSYANSTP